MISILTVANGQMIDPSIGISRGGGTGLASMSSPKTMSGGHLSLGWNQYLAEQAGLADYPLNLTIAISDRTELFVSRHGYQMSHFQTGRESVLGLKVHVLSWRRIPLGLKVSQNTTELSSAHPDTTLLSRIQIEAAALTQYSALSFQVYHHFGAGQTESSKGLITPPYLRTGLGVSRTLLGEQQFFAEIMVKNREGIKPQFQSALGLRSFLFGNLQVEITGLWREDEFGVYNQFSVGLTASTQGLKAPKVQEIPWSQDAIMFLATLIGLESERPQDSNIPPEYFVSWQDRKLPLPPDLNMFREVSEVISPEFTYDETTYLPLPPDLEALRRDTIKE